MRGPVISGRGGRLGPNYVFGRAVMAALASRTRSAPLIARGFLDRSRLTFSRAQPSSSISTAFAGDGVTLDEYAADVPRFNGVSRGLLLEGQRTNLVRNPRFEGSVPGVIGSGGVIATNMSAGGTGVTWTVIATGTLAGLPAIEIDVTTTGATSSPVLSFETVNGAVFAPNSTYTTSVILALTGGSTANFTALLVRGRTDTVTAVNHAGTSFASVNAAPQLFTSSFTTGADAANGRAQLVFTTSAAANIRLLIAAPDLQLGAFASSRILPAVGAPAAATRGGDILTASGAQFTSLFPNGVGTVLATIVPAANNALERYMSFSDGTTGNLFEVFENLGNIQLQIVRGGVVTATAVAPRTIGAPTRLALTFNSAAGTATAQVEAAQATQTAAGSVSVDRLNIGNRVDLARPFFGELRHFEPLPFIIPPAQLPAAVSALPA